MTAAGTATPIINEVMVDPVAVADGLGEWFEVHNPGAGPVDLQGWQLTSRGNGVHVIAGPLVVPAGGYVVLGRNAAQSKNGGVAVNYSYGSSIGLTLYDWLVLRDAAGGMVDSVAWKPAPAGASRGVADPSVDNLDMDGSNWTDQTSAYGLGDKGTPGARNNGYIAPSPAAPPAVITVSPASGSVLVGATQQFSASAVDSAGNPVATTYTWSSSDTAVATVNVNGLATAKAQGAATIRAAAPNGVYGEGTLAGTGAALPAVITVSPPSGSVTVGATQQFSASAVDSAGNPVTTTYTWTSSDTAVATVDANGLATAKAQGTATIRAAAPNGVYGEATLSVTASPGGSPEEVVVRVLDIGQGDANLITNGTSKVFIDGGPSRARFGELVDSLGMNGTTIDAVILSHGHGDHHGGLRELFLSSRKITVRYFFDNQDATASTALQSLRDSVNARVGRGELTYRDTDDPCGDGSPLCTMQLDGGAKLHILRPNPAGGSTNDRSVVVKLVGPDSASFSMWFAGDAEHEELGWFDTGANYDVYPGVKVNVLKADHHGDCDGFTNRFVELTEPDWVTFSLAPNNSTKRIHTQVKDLLTQHGASWQRTDQNGTITIRSPGTPGGGYTISPTHGSANANGPFDAAGSSSKCNPLP